MSETPKQLPVTDPQTGTARLRLLSVAAMGEADRQTIAAGTKGAVLMERAGLAVTDCASAMMPPAAVSILCGPGNNGGDGFVAARLLAERGWTVRVALLGGRESLTGDAAHHAALWQGDTESLGPEVVHGAALVIDAIFGAGLNRPIDGIVRETLEAADTIPILAVDVPTGIDGDSGAVMGFAPQAERTVTFCRLKPGHLLLPGREMCGAVTVADIGISDETVNAVGGAVWQNDPAMWRRCLRKPSPNDHKYSRGHAVIVGGAIMTGAARLAARAAQRTGAGIVTLAAPQDAQTVYKVTLESVVIHPYRDTAGLRELVENPRNDAFLIGPGAGLAGQLRDRVVALLKQGKPTLIDADAISVFENGPELLLNAVQGPCVMTPHLGEFRRIFPDLAPNAAGLNKVDAALAAADRSKSVVVLKGFDTVIASPDGRCVINTNATPSLATAGSGDVLSGIIVSLLAQGMPPFEAAASGVWIHAETGKSPAFGLIPEDLIGNLPGVMHSLLSGPASDMSLPHCLFR